MGNNHYSKDNSNRNEANNKSTKKILIQIGNINRIKILLKTQMIKAVEVKMMIQEVVKVIIMMMTMMMRILTMMIVRWMRVKGKEDRGRKIG